MVIFIISFDDIIATVRQLLTVYLIFMMLLYYTSKIDNERLNVDLYLELH